MLKDNTKYAYAVGRIRVLEDRMIDEGKLLRMTDAPDFEAAFSILNETPYAEFSGMLKTPFDFEELLHLELNRLKSVLDKLAPRNSILECLWFKYDVNNIKTLVKARYLGRSDVECPLFRVGTIDAEVLRIYIFEQSGELPQEMERMINEIQVRYEKTPDPEMIDIVLDKWYFSKLKKAAKLNKVPFFTNLVNSEIDLANIKIFLRLKTEKREQALFESSFAGKGTLDLKFFLELFSKNLEDFVAKFRFSPYHRIVSEGVDFYLKNKSFILAEKLMKNYLIDYLKKAKRLSFGIEPVIGYLLAKESEIKTLRLIFRAKLNDIKTELIKERICCSYV